MKPRGNAFRAHARRQRCEQFQMRRGELIPETEFLHRTRQAREQEGFSFRLCQAG